MATEEQNPSPEDVAAINASIDLASIQRGVAA